MNDELKLCPFCGQYPDVLTGSSIVAVVCPRCGYEFDWPLSSDWRAEWNTRPIEDALQARITELEAQLAERAGVCIWQPDEGFDYTCINTACHQSYVFEDGYEDGDDTYCSHCGRKIRFNPNPEPQEGKE